MKPISAVPAARNFLLEAIEGLFLASVAFVGAAVVLPYGVLAAVTLAALREVTPAILSQVGDRLPLFLTWTGNTLAVSFGAAAFALILALPLAVIVARLRGSASRVAWLAALLFAGTPLYVTTTGWLHLLDLGWLVSADERVQLFVGAWISGVAYLPMAVLLLSASLTSVPGETEEAGRLFAPLPRVVRRVTLPLALHGVLGAGALVAALSAGDITVTDALLLRTYAEQVYLSFHQDMDLARASLVMLPLTLLLVMIWLGLSPLLSRWSAAPETRLHVMPGRWPLGRIGRAFAWLTVAASVLLLAYPVVELAWFGLAYEGRQGFSGAGATGLVAEPWYRQLGPVGTTAILAAAGATIGSTLGAAIAGLILSSRRRWFRRLAWLALLLMLATPGPLVGFSFVKTWNNAAWAELAASTGLAGLADVPRLVYDTPLVVVFLYAARVLPVATLILWAGLRSVPARLVDAARVSGADCHAVFWRVSLPLCRAHLLAAWLVGFVLAVGELSGVVVAAPPGVPILAVRIATLIHFGVYPDLARLALYPLLLCAPAPLLAWWIWRRQGISDIGCGRRI